MALLASQAPCILSWVSQRLCVGTQRAMAHQERTLCPTASVRKEAWQRRFCADRAACQYIRMKTLVMLVKWVYCQVFSVSDDCCSTTEDSLVHARSQQDHSKITTDAESCRRQALGQLSAVIDDDLL